MAGASTSSGGTVPVRAVPAELRRRYLDAGWWTDDTFPSFVERRVADRPDLRVRVWSDERPATTTAATLAADAARIATGLRRRGIEPGDVVAYQLPNWLETLAVLWAGFRLGATLVPIIHFYGAREVGFVLHQSGARALVTTAGFGGVDHLANLAEIRDQLQTLETVVVVGQGAHDSPGAMRAAGHGAVRLDDLHDHEPLAEPVAVDPDAPAMVGYTSGTTADPKGVVHTHRSLLAEVRQLAGLGTFGDRPAVMASPLAHMTGMLGGSLVPLQLGKPIELTDRWDPGRMLRIVAEHDLSPGGGATVFLTSLLDHPDLAPEHLACMPRFGLGGAPVPVAVADRAEALGIRVTRAYGSTEHPSVSGSTPDDPARQRTRTDGRPLQGVELRIVDDDGREVAPGAPGEILTRGPDLFAGYTDPTLTEAAIDADGWYRTGDVGVLDEHGCLTITDRVSDLIIRGGLNLSGAEIEQAVATMPGVAEVAVVGVPDRRLGERACAFVRVAPGGTEPDVESVQAHLRRCGLPKQKWPEAVCVVTSFPRTPSGKIKKRDLRDVRALRDEPA